MSSHADSPVDSPVELTRDDWRTLFRRTLHEFRISQSWDLAAALTYHAVLSVFPALLGALALIGIFGSAEAVARTALDVIGDLAGDQVATAVDEPIEQLLDASHAALAFATGLVLTLWTVSGYLGTFGRGMNRILGVAEGRPFWKSRPLFIGVAVVIVALASIVAVLMLVSGPVADALARSLGLDEGLVIWWDFLKLPVVAVLVAVMIAVLYWATPNVKRRNIRWMSVGAGGALLSWLATTALFTAYVLGVRTYERTYGVLGFAVAFLLWVWLSNLALVFGAVLDTEVERARQLRNGIDAEDGLQLPLRDDRMIQKNRESRNVDRLASSRMKPDTAVDGVVTPSTER
ncbi:YihY/virulence factor BrkB family protein [Agromyces sp. NPDC057865]|uniref:YihY/virulence factor BrkB family protein n=1 Tax=Agromyces sp. NPDC057865 TaxID=3346267 RepID=UPI0036734549